MWLATTRGTMRGRSAREAVRDDTLNTVMRHNVDLTAGSPPAPCGSAAGSCRDHRPAAPEQVVKLCISIACYRWAFQPSIRRDTIEYRAGGGPLAYLQSFEPPPPEDNRFFWMVDKTAELGLQGLYAHPGEYADDRAGAEAMRRKVDDRGLIWNGGLTVNMAATDDEWESFEYDNAVRQLRLNHWAGLTIATMTHRLPSVHNHFSTDPPIDEQMARAAKHLPTLTPVAEDLGVIMAWENHMDYRVSEVAGVVDEIDSPWLRITLDTSNPFPSIEDPLEGRPARRPEYRGGALQGLSRPAAASDVGAAFPLLARGARGLAHRRDPRAAAGRGA